MREAGQPGPPAQRRPTEQGSVIVGATGREQSGKCPRQSRRPGHSWTRVEPPGATLTRRLGLEPQTFVLAAPEAGNAT